MKALIINLMNVFGKYLFAGILYFITGALYFFIFRDGIDSFYYPMIGIFSVIAMTGVSILYTIFFIIKKK